MCTKKTEKEKVKKELSILGINIWKLFTYFILYSILGYIIETIFGIVTKGVWECRQSFLYGPFLAIYGVGAVCIILFSQYFNKNNFTLFIGGFIIGSATEYIISFLTETLLHTQWWDYNGYILNVNGRICLLYSFFWGILTVFLIRKVTPYLDKIIKNLKQKMPKGTAKTIVLAIIVFLAIDCLLTAYAQEKFVTRMVIQNNIEMEYQEKYEADYEKTYGNEKLSNFIYKFLGDRKMIRTFPNIKIEDKNKNIIYLDSLLPDIQPYYIKIFNKAL